MWTTEQSKTYDIYSVRLFLMLLILVSITNTIEATSNYSESHTTKRTKVASNYEQKFTQFSLAKDTPRIIAKNIYNDNGQLGAFCWDLVLNGGPTHRRFDLNFRFMPEMWSAKDSLLGTLKYDSILDSMVTSIKDTVGGLFFNEQGLILRIEYYNRNLMDFYVDGTDSVIRNFEYEFSPFRKRVHVVETVKSNNLDGEIIKHSIYKKNRLISKYISFTDSDYYLLYEVEYCQHNTNSKVTNEGFRSKVVPFYVSSISYSIGHHKDLTLIQTIEFNHSVKYDSQHNKQNHSLFASLSYLEYKPYAEDIYSLEKYSLFHKNLYSLFEFQAYREWYGSENSDAQYFDMSLIDIKSKVYQPGETNTLGPILMMRLDFLPYTEK